MAGVQPKTTLAATGLRKPFAGRAGDLIGCEVMDHVTNTGERNKLALTYLLVKPTGLTVHVNDLIVCTR